MGVEKNKKSHAVYWSASKSVGQSHLFFLTDNFKVAN